MEFSLFKNQTRFKIALTLIDKPEGLSIMQLNELLEDVPQATLYRHVNAMFEEQLLKIVKTKKLRSSEENYYAINSKGYKIDETEWTQANYSKNRLLLLIILCMYYNLIKIIIKQLIRMIKLPFLFQN